MTKNKLTYWQKRYLQITQLRHRNDAEYIKQMQSEYDRLSKNVMSEISDWVSRYAENDSISEDEAHKMLSKQEQKTWSMSLDEFRQKAIDGGYDQELNREYYKSRISRLEQLQRQLCFELAEMANNQESNMSSYLKEQLNETYLRQIYELTDRGSFSLNFSKYSSRALDVALRKPWAGSNFSKRVWKNHLKVIPDKLSKVMSQSIVNGWGIDKTVKAMMTGFDSDLKNRMTTLVQTESAHLAEIANDKSMFETGVERWEWLATLEVHTCEVCGSLDGQMFAIDDKSAPICPRHPNCRCTKVPVIEGWEDVTRWQRDPVTGKGSLVESQSFEEWRQAKNIEHENELSKGEYGANLDYVRSKEFVQKLKNNPKTAHIAEGIANASRKILSHRNGTAFEDYYLLDAKTGKTIAVSNQARKRKEAVYNTKIRDAFKIGESGQYVSIHNHPAGYPPSLADLGSLTLKSKRNTVSMGLTIGHDGSVYWYTAPKLKIPHTMAKTYNQLIEKNVKLGYTEVKAQEIALETFSKEYKFEFGRID